MICWPMCCEFDFGYPVKVFVIPNISGRERYPELVAAGCGSVVFVIHAMSANRQCFRLERPAMKLLAAR